MLLNQSGQFAYKLNRLFFFALQQSHQAVLLENMNNLVAACMPLFYRAGSYIAQSMLDDPAILAMAFC